MIKVDVTLVDGTNQQQFIDSFSGNDSVELVNPLYALPYLLVLNVEDSYLDTLRSNSSVKSVDERLVPTEVSLPPYTTQTGRVVTEENLSAYTSQGGHLLMPLQLYTDTDSMPPSAQTIGNDADDDISNLDNAYYTSCFFGENVDIVTLEAGSPTNAYDGAYWHGNHSDFMDGDGSHRFVPTNWPNTVGGDDNNTHTRNNSFFNSHGLGVLSVAAGTTSGFAKKANLYMYFGGDGIIDGIANITQWHNEKPNNPDTGVPNPTIMISEYQYNQQKARFVPVDSVDYIVHDGVTTNRPGASWGSDLTVFTEKNIIPFRMENPDDSSEDFWVLPWGAISENATIKNGLEAAWDAGIVCIHAAGNGAEVYVKRDDPEFNGTYFHIEDGGDYYRYNTNSQGYITSYSTFTRPDGQDVYPFRSYGPHGCSRDKSIDVAAGQNSEAQPLLDAYTSRGKGIDIVGLGADSYSSIPGSTTTKTFTDGTWGYFSGTSCAAPTVVGKAACMMDQYYHNNGRWPTPNQLKDILLSQAQDKIIGVPSTTWDNVPDASTGTITVPETEDSVHLIRTGVNISYNGHHRMTDLCGTTTKRAFFSGKGFERSQSQGRRPETGGVYPRPKIRR